MSSTSDHLALAFAIVRSDNRPDFAKLVFDSVIVKNRIKDTADLGGLIMALSTLTNLAVTTWAGETDRSVDELFTQLYERYISAAIIIDDDETSGA